MPVGLIEGPTENSPEFVLPVTEKLTVWPDSFAGPVESLAKSEINEIDRSPESSSTLNSESSPQPRQ